MSDTNPEDGRGSPGRLHSRSRLDGGLMVIAVAVASIGMGYLFFTQLWWKLPPDFRCEDGYAFSEAGPDGELIQRPGLCGWIGIEAYYADEPRELFSADIIRGNEGPEVSIPIGPLQRMNGAFIENVVKPNIAWFGYVVWFTEAFIFLSLCLGFLSRLGALAAIGMSMHLMIGLAGIPEPYEWEWSYQLMVILAVALFGIAPGRYFGLDRILRPRLLALAERGSRFSKLLSLFT